MTRRKIFKFSFHLLFLLLLLHLSLQFPLFLDNLHRQTLATIVLSHFTMAATSEQVRKKKAMRKSLILNANKSLKLRFLHYKHVKILDFNYTKPRNDKHAFNSPWCRHKREHQQHEEGKLCSTTVLLHHSSSLMLSEPYRQQVGNSQRGRPGPGRQRVDSRIRRGTAVKQLEPESRAAGPKTQCPVYSWYVSFFLCFLSVLCSYPPTSTSNTTSH